MDIGVTPTGPNACVSLLQRVALLVPDMAKRAAMLETGSAFPAEDFLALRQAGALRAVCPAGFGGLGLGTEPDGALPLMTLLRLLGRGNLSVGRLFEAHVNALKLVCTYGSAECMAAACQDAADGHLFGLWVTGEALRLDNGILHGGKDICSGAGFVTRALVTAGIGAATPVMMVADVSKARVEGEYVQLSGMRAARNAAMDLEGVQAGFVVGAPGDYLRQPVFSAGAWRTAAVTTGGIDALVDSVATALQRRGRAEDPHQSMRLGRMKIAQHASYLWVRQAAPIAENQEDPDLTVAFVDMARLAIEREALDVVQLAQQCLGLAGMIQGEASERIMRDLATYLRQPAGDQALTGAAGYFMQHRLPVF